MADVEATNPPLLTDFKLALVTETKTGKLESVAVVELPTILWEMTNDMIREKKKIEHRKNTIHLEN